MVNNIYKKDNYMYNVNMQKGDTIMFIDFICVVAGAVLGFFVASAMILAGRCNNNK